VVSISRGIQKGEVVRITTGKGELVAIAEAQLEEKEIISQEHGLVALTKRVIMAVGTYPKMWKSKNEVLGSEGISESLLRESILDSLEKEDRDAAA
ncbi:MAG: hypothetical protein OK439_05330, partial [Thaumarchaeota archaeon]|nr:hypothetical protein [Nitrososphaerota archaeon]